MDILPAVLGYISSDEVSCYMRRASSAYFVKCLQRQCSTAVVSSDDDLKKISNHTKRLIVPSVVVYSHEDVKRLKTRVLPILSQMTSFISGGAILWEPTENVWLIPELCGEMDCLPNLQVLGLHLSDYRVFLITAFTTFARQQNLMEKIPNLQKINLYIRPGVDLYDERRDLEHFVGGTQTWKHVDVSIVVGI